MRKNNMLKKCILAFKGILVGFGAIMPGISGGTLCVAFGMYDQLIGLLSRPRETLKNHWRSLCIFIIGAGIGFVGLSGLAGLLMEKNSRLVTCVFIGFIIGTMPKLWKDAGEKGRGRLPIFLMLFAFAIMTALLLILRGNSSVMMSESILSFFFCGIVWALSFIVPGLSSSTLLMFFGLYQPMLIGISKLLPGVVLPLGLGFGICMLLLPRAVSLLYKKHYAEMSHIIIGIVVASMIMIFPADVVSSAEGVFSAALCIACGAAASYLADMLCSRIENQ